MFSLVKLWKVFFFLQVTIWNIIRNTSAFFQNLRHSFELTRKCVWHFETGKKSLQQKLFLCIVFSRTKPCIRRRGAKVNNRKSLEKWRTHWCPPSSFQILSFSTLSHFWTDLLSSGHPLSVRYLCLFSFNSHNLFPKLQTVKISRVFRVHYFLCECWHFCFS